MDLNTVFWVVASITVYVLLTEIINHIYSLRHDYRIVKVTVYGGKSKYLIELYRNTDWKAESTVYNTLYEAQKGLEDLGAIIKEEVIKNGQ